MRFLALIATIFLCLFQLANANIQVNFGGFSYGSIIPEKTITHKFLQENGGITYFNKLLLDKNNSLNNSSFSINYDLLKDGLSEQDQNILVLALDNEYIDSISIPEDELTRTDIVLNFQIIFFNAKNNSLVASIPLEITKNISSKDKLPENKILAELKSIYEIDVINYYQQLLNKFNLKSKFNNRIGITEVFLGDNAKNYLKNKFTGDDIFLKNRFAKSLSSYIAYHNDVAIIPFGQDRTTKTITLRFENTQRQISLPDPDYHVHLTLRGFKSILFKESNINQQWIYGSYVAIKIIQPDYPDEKKKIKMDEQFKQGLNVEMSTRSIKNKDSFEWIFFNDSLKSLFDNFSQQTITLDKQWIKSSSENKNVAKIFNNIKEVYENCK